MTRLNSSIKDSITNACMHHQFDKENETLKKQEHVMGMKLYKTVYSKKTLDAVAKVPTEWFRKDACLRFNCGGYDLRFTVNEAVPVPGRNYGCEIRGAVTGEIAEQAQKFAQEKQDKQNNQEKARKLLRTMLDNIQTIKSLERTWPEGKKFYAKYLEQKEGSSLPVVQVDVVNQALGLSK